MAKKKTPGKRKRTLSLTEAKNAIRGSKNPSAVLAGQLASLPISSQRRLLTWAEKVQFGKRVPASSAFPRSVKDIGLLSDKDKSSPDDVIGLLAARIELHRQTITTFVIAREEFAAAYARSDFSACEAILAQIEAKYGFSLWHSKLRIAVLALSQGLEAQKAYVEDQIQKIGRSPYASILHYVSQRNEESTSAPRFISRVRAVIAKAELPKSQAAHYRYHLAYDLPTGDDERRWLLQHQLQISIIDAYELFVTATISQFSVNQTSLSASMIAAIDVIGGVSDPRIAKIQFLLGLNSSDALQTRNLDADVALISREPLVDRGSTPWSFDDPRSLQIEAIHRSMVDCPPEAQDSIRNDCLRYLVLARTDETEAKNATEEVWKRCLNVGPMTGMDAVFQWADDGFSDQAPQSSTKNLRAALFSRYLDPWDLPWIEGEAADRYHEALVHRYPDSLVVDFTRWFAKGGEFPPGIPDDSPLTHFARARRAYEAQTFDLAISHATVLESSAAFRIDGIRWKCGSLIGKGARNEAIQYAADCLVRAPNLYPVLPIEALLQGKKWKELRPFAREIGLAVLLDFYFRRTGDSETNSFRRWAAEDFVYANKADRPSLLNTDLLSNDSQTTKYFLAEVCVPEVLDLMDSFPSSRSVQEERREICALLVKLDPDHTETYRDEITKITTLLKLDEGVRLLDQSRIFVDREGVLRWSEQELKEQFNRYRSLHEANIGFDMEEFISALRRFVKTQEAFPEQFLVLQRGETDKLLFELITSLRDNFLLSPTHGLDAFLSMRVRHGTLSGMLRGPLEQNHVINQQSAGGKYERDKHWARTLSSATESEVENVELAFLRFSEGFDQAIEDLKSRLQIRRKDRPVGLIEIPLGALHVHTLREQISKDASLEEFVATCMEIFWLLLEESLQAVQRYISTGFRSEVERLFDKLLFDLTAAIEPPERTAIFAGVHRARESAQGAMESVKTWFQHSPETRKAYPIDQAVDVGLEMVRITYRNFAPIIKKQFESITPVVIESVTAIGDVVFTVLDNVYRHSGLLANPKVNISAHLEGDDYIKMTIESEVSTNVDRNTINSRLANVSERIERGEYKTAAVSAEGGTGLLKLKRVLDPYGLRSDALTYGFTESGWFRVEAMFRLLREKA